MSMQKLINKKSKLLIFMLLFIFIMSFPITIYAKKLIVGGENIGIEVKAKGVLVVGFYEIDGISPGKKAGLNIGDNIIKINNQKINEIDDLNNLDTNNDNLKITYERNNMEHETNIILQKDQNNIYKTGLYVKNTIVGIGTLTFIDPETKIFGALGHEIIETATKERFIISTGSIFNSSVLSIDKSMRNNPGEKNAKINFNDIFGTIKKNVNQGIYGTYTRKLAENSILESATDEEIKTGAALIRTVLNNNKIEEYEINILKTLNKNDTKNILFEITDEKLLKKTNGIVQGMSGSPIIQNNKIVGAVTHVVIDNPTKGYGIFISRMLKEAK